MCLARRVYLSDELQVIYDCMYIVGAKYISHKSFGEEGGDVACCGVQRKLQWLRMHQSNGGRVVTKA